MKISTALLVFALAAGASAQGTRKIAVTFSGGHETDPRDHGRPVSLVAGALGVSPEVFREAFSRVHPAPAGREPDPAQVRRNKEALLGALSRYGVNNERLDQVSDQYRYRPGSGELWPCREAKGYAVVANGVVQKIVITEAGSGYCRAPRLVLNGRELRARVRLAFDQDFAKNGRVVGVSL